MKIGFIGCGKQSVKHAKGFLANGITEFIFYDAIVEKAEELAHMFKGLAAKQLDDIFADPNIIVVDICTPVDSHKELALKSIFAKKHFFCEKPFTTSLTEDILIRDHAKQHEVIGMVGYIYRFAPAMIETKRILDLKLLGDIRSALFKIGGKGNHALWKHRLSTNGGALNEMAVHMIDLAIWFFNDVNNAEVLESGTSLPIRCIHNIEYECDAEDHLIAKLETSGKQQQLIVMADFTSAEFNQSIEIHGSNGYIKASIQPDYDNKLYLVDAAHCEFHRGKNKLNTTHSDLYKSQMKYFIELIRTSSLTNISLYDSCKLAIIQNQLKRQMDVKQRKKHHTATA